MSSKFNAKNNLPFWQKALLLLIAFLPFTFALNPTEGVDLSLSRVFILLLFLFWLATSLNQKNLLIDRRPRFWLLIFFFTLSGLSFFWAPDQTRALRKIIFIFSFLPLYFIAYAAFQNKNFSLYFFPVLTWSVFLSALSGIALFVCQFIFGLDFSLKFIARFVAPFFLGQAFSSAVTAFPSWLVNIAGQDFLRAFGSFPDPHLFALYLNLSLPLVVYFVFQSPQTSRFSRFFKIIPFFLLLASLLSFSRAAYLSLIIGTLFYLINLRPKKTIRRHPLVLLFIVSALTFLLILPNPLSSRFFSSFNLSEGSNQGRLLMWQKGIELIQDSPWLGVGLGNFPRIVEPTSHPRDPIYAHNLFLDFGSETGLFNMIILFLIISAPIYLYFRKPSKTKLVLATSLVIFFIHSLFETPFFSVRIFPLFLILLAFDEKS